MTGWFHMQPKVALTWQLQEASQFIAGNWLIIKLGILLLKDTAELGEDAFLGFTTLQL